MREERDCLKRYIILIYIISLLFPLIVRNIKLLYLISFHFSDIKKQSELLELAQQKQSDLESLISKLTKQLNESSRTVESKDKVIAELKTDVSEKMELVRQNHLQRQYLMLERDKLSVLLSHKDSQFNEFRNILKLVLILVRFKRLALLFVCVITILIELEC